MLRPKSKSKSIGANWIDLPEELFDVILSKLVLASDYLRFGAVCKVWRSVALKQKPIRMATMHQHPPMLLVTNQIDYDVSFSKFELHPSRMYSIGDDKLYNDYQPQVYQIPHPNRYIGSSYGWLIMLKYWKIELLNPFTQESLTIVEPNCFVKKLVLSGNPTTCGSSDVFIGAVCWVPREGYSFGFSKIGRESWTLVETCQRNFNMVSDVTFFNGLFYALVDNYRLVAIDYKSSHENNLHAPIIEIVPEWHNIGHIQPPCYPYLVEASNGDLLILQRIVTEIHVVTDDESYPYSYYSSPGTFIVFKLTKSNDREESYSWQQISRLNNGDSIFLAGNHCNFCTSAYCVPNFSNDSTIYFTHNFEEQRFELPHHFDDERHIWWNASEFGKSFRWKAKIHDKDVGVFSMKDGTVGKLQGFKDNAHNYVLPMFWITPTLR